MVNSDWFPDFKEGKEAAFKHVFDQYYRPIHFYAAKFIKEDFTADDIAGETFTKAWIHRRRFKTPKHLKDFLYLVARNACFNFLRDERVRKITDLEFVDLATTVQDDEILWDIERLETRFLERIFNALSSMDEGEVIRMSILQKKSTKEIAAILNISENMVYIAKSRGLKKLRETLKPADWMFFIYVFIGLLN